MMVYYQRVGYWMHSEGKTDYLFKISATIFSILFFVLISCDERGVLHLHIYKHRLIPYELMKSETLVNQMLSMLKQCTPKIIYFMAKFYHSKE